MFAFTFSHVRDRSETYVFFVIAGYVIELERVCERASERERQRDRETERQRAREREREKGEGERERGKGEFVNE